MTPSFDPARLAGLPADLRAELRAMFEAQRAMLEAERIRADREHRRAENELATRLHTESELAASKETVERLQLLVKEYERARFGKRSEKLDPDQLQLVLEDIEIAIAEVEEREDDRARRSGRPATSERAGRAARAFPAHLPRVERVLEPESLACACGCGLMVRIGEDRSSRLDVTPAQYRVIETVRPRYACPKGCAGVAQAPAPAHLIEGGVPTEALLAQVAVAWQPSGAPVSRGLMWQSHPLRQEASLQRSRRPSRVAGSFNPRPDCVGIRTRPLVAALEEFLRAQAARLSGRSDMGKAVAYLLNYWVGLTLFLDDGRVEMATNLVENQIRPLTLTRKNALFGGHDEGGRSWSRLASLIATCKLNSVDPYAWMKATLEAIADGHPQSRIDELMPWAFKSSSPTPAA